MVLLAGDESVDAATVLAGDQALPLASSTDALALSGLGVVDLVLSWASLVLAVVAVVSVFLAADLYGGEIGWALAFVGAGVTVFGLERLWFAFGVLGIAPSPAVRAVNILLLFSAGLLAIGFLQLRQTMASRVS